MKIYELSYISNGKYIMKIDKHLEQRCKHYGTTLKSCKCLGYQFRKKCKHNTYLNDKEKDKVGIVKIDDGEDSIIAIEKYGGEWIDGMIHRGEIYERKGKLFNLV